ncbi:ATP-binding cassette domain-containing protein [Glaciecola siphonariae]|uniref:ATP-binding cassette domain-containing protein n=1 Tax=Glaciecola siphonariae TaxID=521012 RepID=A0ABV9LV10_9ALTE
MSKILEVNNIEYTHSKKRGLFGALQTFTLGPISFDMHSGETIAIIGNNGAGKSLLAKALVGAVSIHKGSIKLGPTEDFSHSAQQARSNDGDANADSDDRDGGDSDSSKSNNSEQAHQKLSMPNANGSERASASRTRGQDIRLILQHNPDALNPSLSIGTILTQTLRLNTDLSDSEKREKIEETLVKVGLLREHYYFYRHMLSDGQQQRVALARALILDPKIIVADEPFAALDPSVRSQTINLILKLQEELGLGFVFISHNIGIVRHISDKVLVMEKGQIIEQGPTAEVFTDPQQPLTQKLIQSHFSMVEKHFSRL